MCGNKCFLLVTLVILCSFQHISADILLCSDYLVSGLNAVNDSELTASSELTEYPDSDFGPRNARLYYQGDTSTTPKRKGGWVPGLSDYENSYIQVKFPRVTTIKSITTQGLYNTKGLWVKTYNLLYSMDAFTWATVTSQDGSPLLFDGNNTPVTTAVLPNVDALAIRIKPVSWNIYPVLRFDVGGCHERTRDENQRSAFARKSVYLYSDMLDLNIVLAAISVSSLKECVFLCRNRKTCIAFSFATVNGMYWCEGYNAWNVVPGRISTDTAFYVNQDILDYYGYKESLGGAFLYNVIEVRKDKVNASVTCTEHLTRLFRIDTKSRMANLHDVISRSDIFKNIYKFYVSGGYTSLGRWMHDGEDDEINIALWSPDNPNATHGHCVLLTQTGLTSVDCAEKHYSICGH